MAAGVLFPPKQTNQGGHPLADLRIHGSGYGSTIPQIYGRFRISGVVIDAEDMVVHQRPSGGSAGNRNATAKTYYTATFAIGICRGPITSIDRIWAEDRLVYDAGQAVAALAGDTFRIYLGDEAQTPDAALIGLHGALQTPAYRGLTYVVFDTLDLSPWGNRIPSFTFEVVAVVPYHTLIENTGNLQIYYRFDSAPGPGQLFDSGPKATVLFLSSGTAGSINPGHPGQGLGRTAGGAAVVRAITGADADLKSPQVTVEGWFQYKGGNPVNGSSSFTYQNPNNGDLGWQMNILPDLVNPNTILRFQHRDAAVNGLVTVFAFSVVRDNLWHYYACTYDTSGLAILYYDGVQQQQTNSPVTLQILDSAQNGPAVTLGDYNLDELAFYSRILTPLELYAHYQGKSSTVGTILADVFNQVGLTPSQYDVSRVQDQTSFVEGFLVHTRQDARTAVQELLRLYDTDLIERDGVLVALKRGGAAVLTVPVADLGAHVTTGAERDPPKKVEVKRLPELELPFRVDLRYYDRANNYQMGLQGATRFSKTQVQEPLTIHTTLVFHQDAARQKAEKELYRQWTEREQHLFSLGPAYLQLCAGDPLNIPVGPTLRRVRIVAMDIGLLGPLGIQAVLDDSFLLTQVAVGTAVVPTVDLVIATTSTVIAWNGNALRDQDATAGGMYVAAFGPTGQDWTGCALYTSRDGGASYQRLDNLSQPSSAGTAATVLTATSPGDVFDAINTVDVNWVSGDPPLSTSDSDVLAGANAALLGTEYIQFATVTPQGGNVYRLSRLLRGRRGSEPHQGEHRIGEPFLLLSNLSVVHYPFGPEMVAKAILLKAVTTSQQLASVTAQTVYLEGDELRCYSPVQLAVTRDGGNNATLTWVRRTRLQGEMQDGHDVPLGELVESYELRVTENSPPAIVGLTLGATTSFNVIGHGYSVNDQIIVYGVVGATQLNGMIGTVTVVTDGDNFTLNINSTGFSPYTAATGTVAKSLRTLLPVVQTASYTAAQQTADGLTPGNPIHFVVYQLGLFGRGWPAFAVV
jgi:hypothetical protein